MTSKNSHETLKQFANKLKLYGLLSHWDEVKQAHWLPDLLEWEMIERTQRSLEHRLHQAKLGHFKPLSEFDWDWPEELPRGVVEEWMTLHFLNDATNLILCGPNGVGKSTIARNISYEAILQGHTALFTTAGTMLNELATQDGDNALQRRMKYYVKPLLLCIDEIGYLSYSNRHADLLFEIISQRYEKKSTLITTNKPFTKWKDIFPNATCVVSIIDRLVHHSEIMNIKAESFRLKEAQEANCMRNEKRISQTNNQTKNGDRKNDEHDN